MSEYLNSLRAKRPSPRKTTRQSHHVESAALVQREAGASPRGMPHRGTRVGLHPSCHTLSLKSRFTTSTRIKMLQRDIASFDKNRQRNRRPLRKAKEDVQDRSRRLLFCASSIPRRCEGCAFNTLSTRPWKLTLSLRPGSSKGGRAVSTSRIRLKVRAVFQWMEPSWKVKDWTGRRP